MHKIIVFTVLLSMISFTSEAQDIGSYKWKNRILLVVFHGIDSKVLKTQLEDLKNHRQGIEERYLKVIQVMPDCYKIGIFENSSWIQSKKLYQDYSRSSKAFQVILIGLDGSVKIRKNTLFKTKDIFLTIDAMPMRKTELKNQKQ